MSEQNWSELLGGDHGGDHDREPVIQKPGRIEDTVTTLLKIQLVTDEDLVVSLCPQNNSNTVKIPPVTCKKH